MVKRVINFLVILIALIATSNVAFAKTRGGEDSDDYINMLVLWEDTTGQFVAAVALKTSGNDVVSYTITGCTMLWGTNSKSGIGVDGYSLPEGGMVGAVGGIKIVTTVVDMVTHTTVKTETTKSFNLRVNITVNPVVKSASVSYDPSTETTGSVTVKAKANMSNGTTREQTEIVSKNGSGTITVEDQSLDYNVNWIAPTISTPSVTYTSSSDTPGSVTVTASANLTNATKSSVSKEVTVSENKSGTIRLSYTGTNGKSYTKDVSYKVNWIAPTVTNSSVSYSPTSGTKGSVTVTATISLKNAKTDSASKDISVSSNGSGSISVPYTGTDGKNYSQSVSYSVTWIMPTVTSKSVSYTPVTGTKNDVVVTAIIYTKNASSSSYKSTKTVSSNTSGSIKISYTGTDGKSYSETLSYNVTWIMPTVTSTNVSYSTTSKTKNNVTVTATIQTKNATQTTWTATKVMEKNGSGSISVSYTGTDGENYVQSLDYSVWNIDKIKPEVSYTVNRYSVIGRSKVSSDTEYEAIEIKVSSVDRENSSYCSSGTKTIYIDGVAYSGSSCSKTYTSTVNSPISIYSVDNVGNVGDKVIISDFVGELIEPISMTISTGKPYLDRNNVVVPLYITDGTRYLREIYVDGVKKSTPARSTVEPYDLYVATDKTSVSGNIKIVDKKGVERNYQYEIDDILKKGQGFSINIGSGDVIIQNDTENSSNDIVYFGQNVGERVSTVVCEPTRDMTLYGTSNIYNATINSTHGRTLRLENLSISQSQGSKAPIDIRGSSNINLMILGSSTLVSNGNYACISVSNDAKICLKGGGSLLAQSLGSGSTIGGNASSNAGDIELLQGKFILKSSGMGSAIGSGGDGSVKSVSIRGADVYASSKDGAAVGSGRNGVVTLIKIDGGTIIAKSDNGGAAIGSGRLGQVANIIINNGQIYTLGIGGGAGIGSGLEAYVDKIRINNGIINCETNGDGVGIGAGRYASANDVIINDGTIVCKNVGNAAAIGTGAYGVINNGIKINGGEIEAYTQGAGCGIGNGNVTINGGVVKAYSKSGYDISGNNIIIGEWANVNAYNNKTSTLVKRSDGESVSQIKIAIPQARNTESFLTITKGDISYRVKTDKNGVANWWKSDSDDISIWYKGLKYEV